jgi:hypothetical protein
VGWWFNRATREPSQRRSNWARSVRYRHLFWGQKIRARIAGQVGRIKDWTIIEGDYTLAPDIEAHWFIDAPYSIAGRHYRVNGIDYAHLAEWCRQRRGFIQVCESSEAHWLPFQPFTLVNSPRVRGYSAEALYEFETDPLPSTTASKRLLPPASKCLFGPPSNRLFGPTSPPSHPRLKSTAAKPLPALRSR